MRASISLSDLQRYVERLPSTKRNPRDGPVVRMAIQPDLDYLYRHSPNHPMHYEMMTVSTIEFHCRPTKVNGVECTAWYYHDILVKVSV
ncbi:hypothetical protein [Mesorhizobium sp. M0598]|uniref:hypothetical protein n=1 Tax=unclassified Mesorhizobium TaxID=325217 RepID=UPI00333DB9A6